MENPQRPKNCSFRSISQGWRKAEIGQLGLSSEWSQSLGPFLFELTLLVRCLFEGIEECLHIVNGSQFGEQMEHFFSWVWEVTWGWKGSGSLLQQFLGGDLKSFSKFLGHPLLLVSRKCCRRCSICG